MPPRFPRLVLQTLALLCLSCSLAAQPLAYPEQSGIVDITKPPYNADSTGVVDASAAINQALFDFNDSHTLIYLPAGTYRLSNPVVWQDPPGCEAGTTFTCRRYIGLTGAGQERTLLQLDDNHPDFQDPTNSQSLINTNSSAAMAFENTIRNLTVSTGTGNPGATGIRFMASNVGGIHHVEIRSEDGQGFRGLNLSPNEQSGPAFYNDIVVDGFDTGIYTFGNQNGIWMERITLRNQGEVGLFNRQHPVAIRNLDFEGDVRGITNQGDGGSTITLVDSELRGTGAASSLIGFQNQNRRPVFMRNVTFSGWNLAYQEFQNGFDLGRLPNGTVDEYTSAPPVSLCDNVLRSLNLPVLETPEIAYEDTSLWVSIADFGAALDPGFAGEGSVQDDSQAIRDALDFAAQNGRETIVIPQPRAPFPQRYIAFGDFVIPPTVKRIIGTKGLVAGTYRFIVGDGTEPLVIEDMVSVSGISHSGDRMLILKHSVIRDYVSNPDGSSGDVFIEDVVGGPWSFNQQDVYARQFNLERDVNNVTINGGMLWALGVKTERKGTIIEANNGARVEILGAFHYSTIAEEVDPKPLYVANESQLSVAGLKELTYIFDPYDIKLRETRNGVTNELANPDNVIRTPLLVAYVDESATNVAPTIEAGEEQILLLPTHETQLTGLINDDANPTGNCFTASNWTQVAGPVDATIVSPTERSTSVQFPEAGRYEFELVADDGSLEVSDRVTVHVFDSFTSTGDHDADGVASGTGADASTQGWGGFTNNYGASQGLLAKNNFSFPNKFIVRFDLTGLDVQQLDHSLLEFEIATTNTGLIEDWSYNVFGLNDLDEGEDWIEGDQTGGATNGGVTYETLPANITDNNFNGGTYDPAVPNSGGVDHARTTFLGTFSTRQGQREKVNLSNEALADFINADTDGRVSFIVTRVFSTTNAIAFASRENTQFQAPRLYGDYSARALPVELLSFDARRTGKNVQLEWTALPLPGFSHFTVERSTPGSAWQTLGRVKANAAYQLIDQQDDPSTERYYRLAMWELDGAVAYSPIRTILPAAAYLPYPNPSNGDVSVHRPGPDVLRLTDVSGAVVAEYAHPGGWYTVSLPSKTGLYVIRSRSSDWAWRVVRE
ncbi:glycosyl hydrolase family 28-related protein [Lewinella sp. 4G2]|uniref:glycosyl hydrolase family 28-related protein n=1 Tax=Lewinella sp. 4G2 TaxID=1803372 RepID=UPI0007E142F2|nr:glycosyl hydrolase family 28-related protein [Lewinella sp. 4G2]OAV45946.1 hypothetical protein A3850_018785 [Lewinella sp. 4G2]